MTWTSINNGRHYSEVSSISEVIGDKNLENTVVILRLIIVLAAREKMLLFDFQIRNIAHLLCTVKK